MRVSNLMFSQNYLPTLNNLQQQQNTLQNEASTGLSVSLPEDDPSVMGNVLNLQAQSSANSQFQNNITELQSSTAFVSTALSALQPLVAKSSEIALSVGGTTSPSDLTNDAGDVESYIQQAVNIGNTKDASGNYIFGGTNTTTPPFVATYDANGNITSVSYQGNTNVLTGDIGSNLTIPTTIPGENTTGSGASGLFKDSSSGADIFGNLISLQKNLASGDTTAVTNTNVPALQIDVDHMTNQISANSVAQATLESAGTNTTDQQSDLSTQISNQTGANLANTLSNLTQTQTAYQAALESGVLVMNLSILQYLG